MYERGQEMHAHRSLQPMRDKSEEETGRRKATRTKNLDKWETEKMNALSTTTLHDSITVHVHPRERPAKATSNECPQPPRFDDFARYRRSITCFRA